MNIEAGRTQYIKGLKLSVELDVLPKKRSIPGDTAIHEAMHVVAAIENGTGVESATIVPGDGYLGLTKLKKPDAVAAMAPHSMGKSGTGHDIFIADVIGNSGAAESAAKGIIKGNLEKVDAVATVLEEKRSIGPGDIYKALDEVDNPRPLAATVYIEDENGEKHIKRVEARDNIIIASQDLIEVFSAKSKIH